MVHDVLLTLRGVPVGFVALGSAICIATTSGDIVNLVATTVAAVAGIVVRVATGIVMRRDERGSHERPNLMLHRARL